MRALFTYMNIHEGTSMSWWHYCDSVYIKWCNFDQSHHSHARISRWGITKPLSPVTPVQWM